MYDFLGEYTSSLIYFKEKQQKSEPKGKKNMKWVPVCLY